MDRWVEETFHPHWRVRLQADEVLHEVKTDHQHLVIFKNKTWGTVLMLDGVCQLTTSDEFIYHEMMAHVPLMALDKPKRVLATGPEVEVVRVRQHDVGAQRAHLVGVERLDRSLRPDGHERRRPDLAARRGEHPGTGGAVGRFDAEVTARPSRRRTSRSDTARRSRPGRWRASPRLRRTP